VTSVIQVPHIPVRSAYALALVSLTLLLSLSGLGARFDSLLFDWGQRSIPRQTSQDLVIVAIDEASLSTLGRWPWPRKLHAQTISNLKADGAAAIGLDILFSEPQQDDPQGDQLLAKAIAAAGNVVLPVAIENTRSRGQLIESLPIPILGAGAAQTGRVHAELDEDNVVRSIWLWGGLGQPFWPHFAQAMLKTAGQLPPSYTQTPPAHITGEPFNLVNAQRKYVSFYSSRQHFQSLSYAQVFKGEFAPGTFKDKMVLIGFTATGLSDKLATPVSGLHSPMPGVVFLANTIESFRANTLIERPANTWTAIISSLMTLIPLAWLAKSSARRILAYNFLLIAGILVVYFSSIFLFNYWVPIASGVLGLFCSYPVWAWLRLEAASQALGAEIALLRQELGKWEPENTPNRALDPIQSRIDQIRAAVQRLASVKNERIRFMEFVSHDIRVPVASAAEQVRQLLGQAHPAHLQLTQALSWTEDFLQSSKAELADPTKFNDLDLVSLVAQAMDDVHPLLGAKQLNLNADIQEDFIWIRGDFQLLLRVIHNLLSNAIKFSPPNGQIDLDVRTTDPLVTIVIRNQSQHDIADVQGVFDAFVQSGSGQPTAQRTGPEGVGLGLYFVKTVMAKHGGTVDLSRQGASVTVTLQWPATRTPESEWA
jgi:CHASE2 domain-containing sensor protein/two-component sensor histidine kinase